VVDDAKLLLSADAPGKSQASVADLDREVVRVKAFLCAELTKDIVQSSSSLRLASSSVLS
jgi:hypothetical protein